MSYTFTTGELATAAKLNQAVGAVTQSGVVKVTPVANTPTSVTVKFPTAFSAIPNVAVTANIITMGDTTKAVSVSGVTKTGCTLWVYRTNTNATTVSWQAWLSATAFTTGQPATAGLLNQGSGGMVAQVGSVTITPSAANTPTYTSVTFPTAFAATPTVMTTALTTVPGQTVLGTASTNISATGCRVYVCRTSTSATVVNWIALGRM